MKKLKGRIKLDREEKLLSCFGSFISWDDHEFYINWRILWPFTGGEISIRKNEAVFYWTVLKKSVLVLQWRHIEFSPRTGIQIGPFFVEWHHAVKDLRFGFGWDYAERWTVTVGNVCLYDEEDYGVKLKRCFTNPDRFYWGFGFVLERPFYDTLKHIPTIS